MYRTRAAGRTRAGISTPLIFGLIAIVAFAAVGVAFLQYNDRGGGRSLAADHYVVARGDFDITIPASGELIAQQQIEIRNRLESRATITEIVDEGTYVQKGDLLMRLNDEEIRNRIKDAEDAVNSARSALTSAEANLRIRKSTRDSDIDRAKLNVELTQLALEAWREGEVVARKQQLKLALQRAKTNLERMEQRVEDSKRLYEREFISYDELQRDEISLLEAQATFLQAEKDVEVYTNYTYQQEKAQKESDVDQALAELDRVVQRHEAEIETARADVASRKFQLDSREERLEDLRRQLEYCEVYAPSEGLVVYASSMETGRRGRSDPPDVGTDLSRNELVMVLPDTSRMVAAVKVNEALTGLISPGQQATVVSDSRPDQAIDGEVTSVAVLAESGGWRDPNRRDYTVRIRLNTQDNNHGLRPSMRARAEIKVDRVENAVHIPIQAVYREGGLAYVYVPEARGYMQKPVTTGRASELYVEITDGLDEGDIVLLRRPSASEIVRTLDDRDDVPPARVREQQDETDPPQLEFPPTSD